MKAGKEKDRAGAEEELHGACRGHRCSHGGENHGRGKLVVQLLQSKSIPVSGALKTAASPAPAPPVRRYCVSVLSRAAARLTPWAEAAPISTAGPA